MATNRSYLVTGGLVLTGNPKHANFKNVDVLVKDGKIVDVGNNLGGDSTEVIDATGCLVTPGFVDSHQHLWQTTMRGLTADWDLTEYLWCIRSHHAAIHRPEDIYAGTYAGALSALESGTTTTIDYSHCINTPEHSDQAVAAIKDSGIRALWCYGFNPVPLETPVFTEPEQRFNDARRIRSSYFSAQSAFDRVTMGVATTEAGIVPWSVTRAEFGMAKELDAFITTHTNAVWTAENKPEVEWYHRDGLLGPNQCHSHANNSTDEELKLLADVGATISSTPDTELQMGMGFPAFARAAGFGVTVGLGGDIQSNNSQDPFIQMRLAMQAQNGYVNQPTIERDGLSGLTGAPVAPHEVLYYATLGSAEALGLGDVTGSIDKGKAADLLLVRVDGLRQRPIVDPVKTLVMQCGIGEVDVVMVDGEIVKRDGKLIHRDTRHAASLVDDTYEWLDEQIARRGGWRPSHAPDFASITMQHWDTIADEIRSK